MKSKAIDNHKRFLERIEFYKKFGLGHIKEREFVLDKSLPIGDNILEIGTGKGHFSYIPAKNEYRVTTV